MRGTSHSICVAFLRRLDWLQHSLLVLGALVFLNSGCVWPGGISGWYMVPIAVMTISAITRPRRVSLDAGAEETLWRLRVSAVFTLGLSPFVGWSLNSAGGAYLFIGAFWAGLGFFWHVSEHVRWWRWVVSRVGEERLVRQGDGLLQALLYFSVAPLVSLYLAVAVWPVVAPSTFPAGAVGVGVWQHVPWPFVLVLTAPVACFFVYLGAVKRRVCAWSEETWCWLENRGDE